MNISAFLEYRCNISTRQKRDFGAQPTQLKVIYGLTTANIAVSVVASHFRFHKVIFIIKPCFAKRNICFYK